MRYDKIYNICLKYNNYKLEYNDIKILLIFFFKGFYVFSFSDIEFENESLYN